MPMTRSFARAAAVALALVGLSRPGLAAPLVLLTNLDESPQPGTGAFLYTGQAFQAGTQFVGLPDVTIQVNASYRPSSSLKLELESRKGDGTVGGLLFSDFAASVIPNGPTIPAGSERILFTPKSPFLLTAGAVYWLVVSDSSQNGVPWQFTPVDSYVSKAAYGIPAFHSSWTSNADFGGGTASTYYEPATGNQIFQLSTSVPAPSSLLLAVSGAGISAVFGFRKRQAPKR
jgi:hypothetical protein